MGNFGSDHVESLALVAELPMLVFHVSVAVFIAAKVRRLSEASDKVFYKLYLIYCASNYMRYFTIVVVRHQLIPGGPFPNTIVSIWGLNTFFHFGLFLQHAAYSLIALNRWTALAFPLRHRHIWTRLPIRYLTVMLVLVALSAAMFPTTTGLFYLWTEKMDETEAYRAGFKIAGAALISFDLFLTSLDVVLEIWSFFAYRNLSFRGKRENVENLRLLVFSMTQMIPQLLKSAHNVATTARILMPVFVDTAVTFLKSFQALSGPLCLLAVSVTLRREYKLFYGRAKPSTPIVSLTAAGQT